MTETVPKKPFRIERMMHPASVAVIGAGGTAGAQVLANLWASPFNGTIQAADDDAAGLSSAPDLAVIATPPDRVASALAALGALKCPAALLLGPAPDLAPAARASGVRVLGPESFGLAVPGIGLNASRSHVAVPAGRLALVSQSASLCRTVIDWAEPNGVGFSHVIGIGGNEDVGFRQVLDWLSHDHGTGVILLDLRRLKHRSGFLSAVRAAARLRPVVAIRPGTRLADPSGVADLAFAAAFRRTGALSVDGLEALLAAAETLTRARPAQREGLVILANAGSLGRMAADAAWRGGVALASLSEATRAALTPLLPAPPDGPLLYVPPGGTMRIAELAAVLAHAPEVGGLMVVLTPTGPGDEAAVTSLIEARGGALPLLACVMGEVTAEGHRRRLAQAGLAVFSGPEQAVRGFLHLVHSRRSRIAARELPPRTVLAVSPDVQAVRDVFAATRAAATLDVAPVQGLAVMAAYGIALGRPDEPGPVAEIRVAEDAMFGPVIVLETAAGLRLADLPPLNLTLAHAMLAGGRLDAAFAETLVRVSQLVVDWPDIAALTLRTAGGRALAAGLRLRAEPPDATRHLAIPPYPAELTGNFAAGDESFTIRPIRPEDAEAHAAFFHRLAPEDIRFRFFSVMREISPEQMARMTQVDYIREMAFIAVRDATGETVGVSRLVYDAGEGASEFAVVVQPDVKGKGLASHLMHRLVDWARLQGIDTIVGLVLADNHPMLSFVRRLGFRLRHVPDEPELVQAVLELAT